MPKFYEFGRVSAASGFRYQKTWLSIHIFQGKLVCTVRSKCFAASVRTGTHQIFMKRLKTTATSDGDLPDVALKSEITP